MGALAGSHSSVPCWMVWLPPCRFQSRSMQLAWGRDRMHAWIHRAKQSRHEEAHESDGSRIGKPGGKREILFCIKNLRSRIQFFSATFRLITGLFAIPSALSLNIYRSFCLFYARVHIKACSMMHLSTPHKSLADQKKTSLL